MFVIVSSLLSYFLRQFDKMKPIAYETRNNIISLLDTGLPSRQIASRVGVSRSTIDRLRSTVRPTINKHKGGRPSMLSVVDRRRVTRMVTSGVSTTAAQASRELRQSTEINVSAQTVRRILKSSGLKAVVKKKKPQLLAHHMRARLDFAKRYRNWTSDDWKRVIWSDETKINRLGSDGRDWAWKGVNEGLSAKEIKGTRKFGGGSLMFWGCMTAKGVGNACRIEGRMNAELYTDILNDELLETIRQQELDKLLIIFQQDNDPKHTSKRAQQWLRENEIQTLEWPSQSPDLNPIEHLWVHLKRRLATYKNEPNGLEELWERVQEEWNRIPAAVCIDLIDSMPRRVAAVIKAKGSYTKY